MPKKDGENCYNDIDCESNLCVANICTQQSTSAHIEKERKFANALKSIEEKKEELDNQEYKKKLDELQKQMDELDKKKAELDKKKAELNKEKAEKEKDIKGSEKRKETTKLDLERQRRLVKRHTQTKEIISNLEKREKEYHKDEDEKNKNKCIIEGTKISHTDNKLTCKGCGYSISEKSAIDLYDKGNFICPNCREPYHEEATNSFKNVFDKKEQDYEAARRKLHPPKMPAITENLGQDVLSRTIFHEINRQHNYKDKAEYLDESREIVNDDEVSTIYMRDYYLDFNENSNTHGKGRHPKVRNIHRYQEIELEVQAGRLKYVGPKYHSREMVIIPFGGLDVQLDPRSDTFIFEYAELLPVAFQNAVQQQEIQQQIERERIQQQVQQQHDDIAHQSDILRQQQQQQRAQEQQNDDDVQDAANALAGLRIEDNIQPQQNGNQELDDRDRDAANAPPANATPRELREYLQVLRRRIGGPRQLREDRERELQHQQEQQSQQSHPIESEPGWDSEQQVLYRGHDDDDEPMEIEEIPTPQEQQQPMYPQRQVPFNINLLFHGRLLNRAYVHKFIEVYGEPSIQTPKIINNRKLIGFDQLFVGMYKPIFDNNYDPNHDDDPDLGGKRKTRRRKHLRKTKKGKKSKKTKSKKTKSKKTKSRRK